MNILVDYASDSSDSEVEHSVKTPSANSNPTPATQQSVQSTSQSSSLPPSEPGPATDTKADDANTDETFISAALKELQSFAASMDESTSVPTDAETKDPIPELQANVDNEFSSEEENDEEEVPVPTPSILTPEQQTIFKAFMDRIDTIPFTSTDQTHPPAVPKRPLSPQDHEQVEREWQRHQSVPSIYSRIHRLSALESPTLDHEELEARLIEFAIRILDWEQGGLNAVYFLGAERATYTSRERDNEGTDGGGEAHEGEKFPPPYEGVVGETLQHLYELEATAAPEHWKLAWNAEEEAYSFHHIVTGTVSEEYPPQDMLDRLDPKPPKSPVSFKKRTSPSTSPEPMTSIPDAKKQKIQESDSE